MSKSERNQKKVRKLSQLRENKECMDCQLKSTPYVVMDYCTFVCSVCSGIHRHFQHRVKGISMSNFKDDEVDKLTNGGNAKANKVWRATWNEKQYAKPKAYKEHHIKKFIRLTYEKKQWYSEDPNASASHAEDDTHSDASSSHHREKHRKDEDLPEVRPINEIIDQPIQIQIDRNSSKNKQQQQQSGFDDDDDDWDANFDEPTPQTNNNRDQNDLNAFFGDSSAPAQQTNNASNPAPNQQKQQKSNIDLDSLFDSAPQQNQNQFQNQQFQNQMYPQQQMPHQYQNPMYDQQQFQQFQQMPQQQFQQYQQQMPQQYQNQMYGQQFQNQQFQNQQFQQMPQGMQQFYGNNGMQDAPQNVSNSNPFGGNDGNFGQQNMNGPQNMNNPNPFGGEKSNNSGVQNKPQQQQKEQDDPFKSLAGLGKSSMSTSNASQNNQQQNGGGFDDFPF